MNLRRRLTILTVIYWFLLAYVTAALVWWFISLEQQNEAMTQHWLSEISAQDPQADVKRAEVLDFRQRKHLQYVGEGVIFMLLIMVGAVFVYRSSRRYFIMGQQQQNFMMAVTHELKTPISVARLNVETLRKRKLEPEQQDRLLKQTLAETDRLNDLCNNILLAARLDAGSLSAHKEPVSLSQLARDVAQQFGDRYPDRLILTNIPDVPLMMEGEPMLLRMLLNNLVENAIKYAPRHSPVTLGASQEGRQLKCWVADEGPGVPEAERSRIFDKFYRVGNEATRHTRGTGLGLYLCRKIAGDHGGTLSFAENKPQGSIFTTTFNT
jgi:signal transduction histidine kinase